jgi:hypothetical protein
MEDLTEVKREQEQGKKLETMERKSRDLMTL